MSCCTKHAYDGIKSTGNTSIIEKTRYIDDIYLFIPMGKPIRKSDMSYKNLTITVKIVY